MRSLPLLAAVSICLLAAGCRAGRTGEARAVVPELAMEGVRFAVDRDGRSRAWGDADQLVYRRDTTAVSATGLTLVIAGPEGEVRVTAPHGSGVGTERHFEVDGGIQATRGTDVALTASARYEAPQNGAGVVTGPEPVTVTGPGYRLTGKSFRLYPMTGEILLQNGARLVAGLPVNP